MHHFYEFSNLADAEKAHANKKRLGFRPFSIFKSKSGWGFWSY